MKTPSRALVLAALLAAWPAAARENGNFDCSTEDGRKDFLAAFKDASSDTQAYLSKRKVRSTAGDARECVLPEWCTVHRAKVKFSVDTRPGGASTAGLTSTPLTPCQDSWKPDCRLYNECSHDTPALVSGKADSAARFKKGRDGKVKVGGTALAVSGGTLDAASGGGWRGLVFSWGGETYRVQHKTRFIFHKTASGLEDTGAALPDEVLADVCATSDALKAECAAGDGLSCELVGLSRVKGKKGRFKDARGGSWKEENGVCGPA